MSVNPGDGLSPDDVGARVSVRHRASDGRTDVIGDLESVDADQLAIRRSDGSLAVILVDSVLASRVVGPSPLSARELEAVTGRTWPAPDEEWLGGWWLRSAGGFTARANSMRPLRDPGRSFDDALAYVVAWYAQRDLPPMIRVVSGTSAGVELDRRGWISAREAVVSTVTVARLKRLLAARPSAAVQIAMLPPQSWLRRYEGGAITPAGLHVLTGAPGAAFATIDAAEPTAPAIAIGRAAVEPPWVGFTAIEVDPSTRRRGHGRAVMLALTEWAASRGATRAWLEVLATNQPALALYESLGFTEHYRYTYRIPSD